MGVCLFACTRACIVKWLSRFFFLCVCVFCAWESNIVMLPLTLRQSLHEFLHLLHSSFLIFMFLGVLHDQPFPGPLLHIPPFSLKETNARADADHLFSPHACVWRQSPPACLWLSREAFIAMCSSLLGSLVWVWDHNILFVTPSLIRANCLFLLFHVSILPETWFPEWMFFRHSLEVLNVLAKDTAGLSLW